jgi:hypothetical protein
VNQDENRGVSKRREGTGRFDLRWPTRPLRDVADPMTPVLVDLEHVPDGLDWDAFRGATFLGGTDTT